MKRLRICLIASSRFPVAEPFAGGLEAHTHALAHALRARGHQVTLFAAPGSDPRLAVDTLDVDPFESSDTARADVGASPAEWMQEHHAYLGLMLELARTGASRFDVVHNNSLHHLPVAMSATLGVPMVTTLHTPPTPWLESAMQLTPSARFVAVSDFTARQWSETTRARVILNGVDTERWSPGPGGPGAVWIGRVVPEKGAHLAIEAARIAGMPLDLAGPVHDLDYFERRIRPRLDSRIRYLGHLSTRELVQHVGRAAVTAVTPLWDEPYGLVAAESMACGTPVAAFERGALGEIVSPSSGRLATPGDPDSLARALVAAAALPRAGVRRHAEEHCSLDAMVDRYELLYDELAAPARAA
ncbi:glycosyltransferase [Herbiconiux daphne]|uniref:Glycosyltransferase n=1 Tax=Herbiconiux daphne TaxID=2970914 RepID=A0ABT2H5Q3_9MICO|nr:glycosyltransferase [Herbiconiux daphne]MCS5735218.1 glycosyltransferase [Herbiconiux daphne]